jgi:hypothetical protein
LRWLNGNEDERLAWKGQNTIYPSRHLHLHLLGHGRQACCPKWQGATNAVKMEAVFFFGL